jgi:nitrilase
MERVTVAVIQAGSHLFDTAATLAKVKALTGDAARQGAQVIVLPEAIIGGYPKGLDFGVAVGSRTTAGREIYRRYFESAIEIPGPETAALESAIRAHDAYVVAGAVERRGGTLYCAALFFGPQGLLGLHRKVMPTAAERLIWGSGDGSTMPVIDTGHARLGAAICWENYMPLFRTAMYTKGIDLWCAPTVDDRDTWQATMRHVALEGRCFVLSVSQFMPRSNMPDDLSPLQGNDPATVLIGGGSTIISPLGEILAGPLRDTEGILTATLDLGEIARSRFDLDVTGHYSRPDIFTLTTDERRA